MIGFPHFKGFRLMPPTLKIKVSLALEAWLEALRNDFWAAWGQSLLGLCGLAAGAGWIMLVSLDAHAPIRAQIEPQAPLERHLRALSPSLGVQCIVSWSPWEAPAQKQR